MFHTVFTFLTHDRTMDHRVPSPSRTQSNPGQSDNSSTTSRISEVTLLAHDLRGRLGCIRGIAELFTDGLVGDLTDEQSKFLERMEQLATEIEPLLDRVLAYATHGAGFPETAPVTCGEPEAEAY